ncbi:intracellular septation protein [Sphingomonas jejuensis]|uniref:Inner membrane-spanning protein YciB n=1 Tax=Sphingomonas jejuensis TaxID=904715 RepID=A0ABX0XJE3_9SPHN|nr:septation protein A [Sphingomonas jejuensis]NJC33360.1 intracellular septation protein [Sphingomonas jejuensis]
MTTADPSPRAPMSTGLRLAVDYGPLVIFFATNQLAPGALHIQRVLTATAAFMLAQMAAIAVSWWVERRVPPMLWITGALVLAFGALTFLFRDERFIQMKPTFVYLLFAGTLGIGLMTGRPMLKMLLDTTYPGLTDLGWRKLTRNWTLFFLAMAILNEIVWRSTNFDFWVGFKLWGAIPLTLVFVLANIPMLLKNGLADPTDPIAKPPAEG